MVESESDAAADAPEATDGDRPAATVEHASSDAAPELFFD